MPRSIRWLAFSAAVMTVAWPGGRAEASFTYGISGTFGADTGLPTGLAGGSFSGIYTTFGFPTSPSDFVDFSDYNVNIFDKSGNLVINFKFVSVFDQYDDGFFETGVNGPDRGLMGFYHQDPRTNALTELQLVFPLPFNGIGSAIPYDPTERSPSLFYINRRIVAVASATSFAVPAPPSVALVGIAGLAGLGRSGLRRRRPAAS